VGAAKSLLHNLPCLHACAARERVQVLRPLRSCAAPEGQAPGAVRNLCRRNPRPTYVFLILVSVRFSSTVDRERIRVMRGGQRGQGQTGVEAHGKGRCGRERPINRRWTNGDLQYDCLMPPLLSPFLLIQKKSSSLRRSLFPAPTSSCHDSPTTETLVPSSPLSAHGTSIVLVVSLAWLRVRSYVVVVVEQQKGAPLTQTSLPSFSSVFLHDSTGQHASTTWLLARFSMFSSQADVRKHISTMMNVLQSISVIGPFPRILPLVSVRDVTCAVYIQDNR